jgi:hypothetical protein
VLYHGLVVRERAKRERAKRHWSLKNTGFKLVAGKFIFRSKKIGGSRKVNWWLRNFRPPINPVYVSRIDSSVLVFSLSSHRHSYRSYLYLSFYRFIINIEAKVGNTLTKVATWRVNLPTQCIRDV